MRTAALLAALLLAGCATDQPRPGAWIAGLAAVATIAIVNSERDDESDQYCKTVIKPSAGGGIGTNTTICTK